MIKVWLVKDPEQWRNHLKLNTGDFTALTRDEFLAVGEAMKWARVIKGSSILVSIGLDVPEIWELYKTGGHWAKETIEDIAGLGASTVGGIVGSFLVAGTFLALSLTPIGWVVILGGAATSLAFEEYTKYKIEKELEKIQ